MHAHVHVCVAYACKKCENVSSICVMYVRVCICVCLYVCLHVCVRSCVLMVCVHARLHASMPVFTNVSTDVYYMCTIYVRPYTYMMHMMTTSLDHVVQKEQAVQGLKAAR